MRTTGWRLGVTAGLVGAVAVTVLGLLTGGVGATAAPRGAPLAVAVEPGGPLGPLADRVADQGGDAVSWRVVDPAEATRLLDVAEVYGVLTLTAGPAGPTITTTTSGAAPAVGTQVAEQVLARPGAPTVGAALTAAGLAAVLGPAVVVVGYAGLWDLGVGWTGGALGFLVLDAAAFALLQAGVLRLLGVGGTGVLALLYLSALAVAGQVPELLHPAYRDWLWSWTPFRFGSEALRSLLFSGGIAPTVGAGLAVVGGTAVLGGVLLAVPRRVAPPAAAPVPVG